MSFPNDATQDYPPQALAWVGKYDITVEQLLQNNVYYSKLRNQVIFGFFDGEGRIVAWQARNLNPVSKAKRYYTQGDINNVLPIYRYRDAVGDYPSGLVRRLVLVEDCLSAIKVASLGSEAICEKPSGFDSMPCLGSSVPKAKIARLRHLYNHLTVFLDGDMYPNAVKIAQQAQLLGFKTKVVHSELDPKEHSRKQLTEMLM